MTTYIHKYVHRILHVIMFTLMYLHVSFTIRGILACVGKTLKRNVVVVVVVDVAYVQG